MQEAIPLCNACENGNSCEAAIIIAAGYPCRTTRKAQFQLVFRKGKGIGPLLIADFHIIPPFCRMKSVAVQIILTSFDRTRKRKARALPG